ncbi:MAG: hypothetical protein HQ528_02030 [Candidatus Marinimicrobia bacterium]|nr:hypothetical protein [Candidatus Neomarinimicrobiota bacterium]
MRWVLIILCFIVFTGAQTPELETDLSPVVVYWKTLTPGEKEIFLFSYLTQVYETHTAMKKQLGYNDVTTWYYNNIAELVYGVFDSMQEVKMQEFVGWIDQFYSHEDFMNRPFYEALEFAFRYQQAAGETMWEKYKNMEFDSIKPGD